MIYFMEDEPINSVERLAEILWKATLAPSSPEDIALGVQSLREISCEHGLYWPGHQHTSECSRAWTLCASSRYKGASYCIHDSRYSQAQRCFVDSTLLHQDKLTRCDRGHAQTVASGGRTQQSLLARGLLAHPMRVRSRYSDW